MIDLHLDRFCPLEDPFISIYTERISCMRHKFILVGGLQGSLHFIQIIKVIPSYGDSDAKPQMK